MRSSASWEVGSFTSLIFLVYFLAFSWFRGSGVSIRYGSWRTQELFVMEQPLCWIVWAFCPWSLQGSGFRVTVQGFSAPGVMQGFAVHILGCFVFRVSDFFAPVSVCSPNMPRVDSFLTSGTSQCVCCPQSRVQSLGFQIR